MQTNELFELPNNKTWEHEGADIIYIPSQTVPISELIKLEGFVHYEERPLLSAILRLRNPKVRLCYVSSVEIPPETIDYYFCIAENKSAYQNGCNGNNNSNSRDNNNDDDHSQSSSSSSLRDRFYYLYVGDNIVESLAMKLLNRPDLLDKIRAWAREDHAYMYCVIPSDLEVQISHILGVQLYSNPPALNYLGTKFGSRSIFDLAEIPFPGGTPQVNNTEDLIRELITLWKKYPNINHIVIKLNQGISGVGNTLLNISKVRRNLIAILKNKNKYTFASEDDDNFDLHSLDLDDLFDLREVLLHQLHHELEYVDENETWETFEHKMMDMYAIAEIWIDHSADLSSPSAQAEIRYYSKDVALISTHEQLLEKNSKYLGCVFPACEKYQRAIGEMTVKVGKVLALHGAKERFGVDFVVSPKKAKRIHNQNHPHTDHCQSDYDIYAIEINLRTGGTTHPYEIAKLLVEGTYDPSDGFLYTSILSPEGKEVKERRCYKATDNLTSEHYKHLSLPSFFTLLQSTPLNWNPLTKKGCVFYITGSLTEYGKLAFLAIGNSKEESAELFDKFILFMNNAMNNRQ